MLNRRAVRTILVTLLAALSLTGATTMAVACSISADRGWAQSSAGSTDEDQVGDRSSLCASACAAVEPPEPLSPISWAPGRPTAGEADVQSVSHQARPETPPPRRRTHQNALT